MLHSLHGEALADWNSCQGIKMELGETAHLVKEVEVGYFKIPGMREWKQDTDILLS